MPVCDADDYLGSRRCVFRRLTKSVRSSDEGNMSISGLIQYVALPIASNKRSLAALGDYP